jgi:hypothetical protein
MSQGQSSLLIGPPGSFSGNILSEVAFAHAAHFHTIVLCDLETEVGTVYEAYSRWCQAREIQPSRNLYTIHGTWKCATIEALCQTIGDQVDKAITDSAKLLVVRDLSTGATCRPKFSMVPPGQGVKPSAPMQGDYGWSVGRPKPHSTR